ncbi:MAG: hypothetical protein AB7P99_14425 [Vicinamibacterales bacterium]
MTFFNLDERTERANAAFMQRVAALPLPGVSRDTRLLPAQIWWKAQLLRRWDAERRVTAPLDFMQPVEVAAGLACVVFLLYRAAPYFF